MAYEQADKTVAAKARTELRLALVCYGGVSLAVYMHGVTKELHKLICAAREFDNNPNHNKFAASTTEAVYFDTLRDFAESESGPKLSVSIDIIGGTSAGGINGIALSKAIACNVDMEPLKEVWIGQGDIRQLLRGTHKVPLPLQVVLTVGWQLLKVFGNSSPLKGEYMSKLLYEALMKMESKRPKPASSLLPDITSALELYVPTTDLNGFDVLVASGAGGASNRDHDFRQVMVFSGKGKELEQFGEKYTADLAFAGRASSSFPGAFAPVSQGSFADEVAGQVQGVAVEDIKLHSKSVFLCPYGSTDAAAELDENAAEDAARKAAKDVYFVDGGVLDNAPFDLVIDAIARREAQTQVYRQLVYIEPDPGQALYATITNATPDPKRQWLKNLVAVNGVRGSHPILADLTRLRDLNWRIAEVRAISEQQEQHVEDQTNKILTKVWEQTGGNTSKSREPVQDKTMTEFATKLTPDNIRVASDQLYEKAEESLEPVWPTYLRLRLEAVLKQLSTDICWSLQFPKPSGKAGFIATGWIEWARHHEAWTKPELLRDMLDKTDMLYHQRRLLFIVAGINSMYDSRPTLAGDLDKLKGAAWEIVQDIRRCIDTAVGALKAEGALNFLNISSDAAVTMSPVAFAKEKENAAKFQMLFDQYTAKVAPQAQDSVKLLDAFKDNTEKGGWTEKDRAALVSRYLGFPLWDGMLFPTISLTDLPQLNPVPVTQFSPINATALTPPIEKKGEKLRAPTKDEPVPAKLKGIPVKHFAAFFAAKSRANDYLWGRLDGVELILKLLADVGKTEDSAVTPQEKPLPPNLKKALGAVLTSEAGLDLVKDLREYLKDEVDKLPEESTVATDSLNA